MDKGFLPPTGKVSRQAGIGLFLSACAIPVGAAGAVVGIVVSHLAWMRCVRDPELQGKSLAGAGLALGYGIFVLSLAGLLTPSAAEFSHHGALITNQIRRGPVEQLASPDPETYEIVSTIKATARTNSVLGLAASGSGGHGPLYEQALAAGGDDFINERRVVRVWSFFGLYRTRESTNFAVAIRYKTR